MRVFNPELHTFINENVPQHEALPYEFYVRHAIAEPSLSAVPEYNWSEFGRTGISPFLGETAVKLTEFDDLASLLIDNYSSASDLYPAVLDSALEIEKLIRAVLKDSAVVVLMPHSSLGSMLPVQRALIEALGPDFRHKMYEVQGPFPQVFSIGGKISPYALTKTLGAIVRTVGVTPSNAIGNDYTKEEQDEIRDWQSDRRKEYKEAMSHILSTPGNIALVHTSGRRAVDLSETVRQDYRPTDRLSYLAGQRIALVPAGVFDDLPKSGPVHVKFEDVFEPSIYDKAGILKIVRRSCELSLTPNGRTTKLEGRFDQTRRMLREGIHQSRQRSIGQEFQS